MTARQIFEGLLTELSKVNAPSMLLSDFNYFINKAVNQYVNKRYNIYDVSQQTTDDLRVLKSEACLENVTQVKPTSKKSAGRAKLFGATYEVYLPDDYLHILNCVCIYRLTRNYKCYNKNDYVSFAAKRLTADSWSIIQNDFYNRPLPERPYFYIHNVNKNNEIPTNPFNKDDNTGTDMVGDYKFGDYEYTIKKQGSEELIENATFDGTSFKKGANTYLKSEYEVVDFHRKASEDNSNLPRTIKLKEIAPNSKLTADAVEKETAYRYGNASKVRMEIRYGHDDSVFKLDEVCIDYIKAPQYIRLTQEQVNLTEDTSQIIEFPDYVCQEIINELVTLVLENTANPRLQSHPVVTQSIANPAQQQAAPQQQQG